MQELYKVRIKRYYQDFYVLANGYDEAEQKVLRHYLENEESGNILDKDGSLNKNFLEEQKVVVSQIECLGNNFIL